jgi:hypothetical protein
MALKHSPALPRGGVPDTCVAVVACIWRGVAGGLGLARAASNLCIAYLWGGGAEG